MIIETVRRLILRLYPELRAGHHLPAFAVVESHTEAPIKGGLADPFRPRYAVNVRLLDEHGQVDTGQPLLEAVPVSLPGAGPQRGLACLPSPGTVVEIAWAYGRPWLPFIRSVLPTRQSLPDCGPNEQVWQQRAGVCQKMDAQGNVSRTTDATMTDTSAGRIIQAQELLTGLLNELRQIQEHSTEQVGGTKHMESGALNVLAEHHIQLGTGGNFSTTVAGNRQDLTAGNAHEITTGTRHCEAHQWWIGNQDHNLLKIIQQLATATATALSALASHNHDHPMGPTKGPSCAGTLSSQASAINTTKTQQLDPMTK